jgi:hypothetical protein
MDRSGEIEARGGIDWGKHGRLIAIITILKQTRQVLTCSLSYRGFGGSVLPWGG